MVNTTKTTKSVWFPELDNGEVHPSNPHDGYGGGLYKLETVHYIYYTKDGCRPSETMDNVLEGFLAIDAAKIEVLGKDWQKTTDLVYREFRLPLDKGGCNGDWDTLEEKLSNIDEPYWSIIGQLWSTLNGTLPRKEETAISCA